MNRVNVSFAAALGLLLSLTGSPSAIAQQGQVDFRTRILPILGRSCFECHGTPEKTDTGKLKRAKGGLRLDGIGWILKGGDGGRVLVPGKPDRSSLYTRLTLPEDHEDVMPSKGDLLKAEEQEHFKLWILAGANFGGWSGVKGPGAGKDKPALNTEGHSPRVAAWMRLNEGLRQASPSAIKRAMGKVGTVESVMEGSGLLRVRFTTRETEVTDLDIAALAPLRLNITVLDLADCNRITDTALASIGQMPRLTRLDLRGTKVTDRGLYRLTPLKELRYINLYGARITDAGMESLNRIPTLESVYVWKTRVSAGGAAGLQRRLRKRNPRARVLQKPALPPKPRN